MITITQNAAKQINFSAEKSGIKNAVMRIAIRKLDTGEFQYALGFDDAISANDIEFKSVGIALVINPQSLELGKDLAIDYVELDSGDKNFIFLNPLDPNYQAPSDMVGHDANE
ncbi:MAG: iron-sulfur cluster assembly protein [Gammaproteobacteria bacterium]|jgi:iron-sulfur cluster assembly protein